MRPLRGAEPGQQLTEGDGEEALSIEGSLNLLRALYGARIEAVRRDKPKADRAAAISALRHELKVAIRALTERRRNDAASRRATWRQRRQPREPELTKYMWISRGAQA
jgi:hypothetical protein